MIRNKSINHHTPQPPNVKSFNKPKTVCPRTKRSIPNPPKKREITKIVVGFSAETENLNKNSIAKMRQKNCDLMVANDVSKKGIGFNSDYNQVLIFDNNGNIKSIKKNKKSFVANKIAEIILDKLLLNDSNFN